ncbi:hypothetical protein [Aeromicrobium sp. 179-A 4D2 NHS]|uniref:hypothetical protein n=1 Tax=Aeromicrobium sp. 179-A 4D2 NHS TaxID=3142375 RepID=UPI0039A2CFDB
MRFRTQQATEKAESEVREPHPHPLGTWTTSVTRTAAIKMSNGRVLGVNAIESVMPITDPDTGESLGCIIETMSGKTYNLSTPVDEVLDVWLGPKVPAGRVSQT